MPLIDVVESRALQARFNTVVYQIPSEVGINPVGADLNLPDVNWVPPRPVNSIVQYGFTRFYLGTRITFPDGGEIEAGNFAGGIIVSPRTNAGFSAQMREIDTIRMGEADSANVGTYVPIPLGSANWYLAIVFFNGNRAIWPILQSSSVEDQGLRAAQYVVGDPVTIVPLSGADADMGGNAAEVFVYNVGEAIRGNTEGGGLVFHESRPIRSLWCTVFEEPGQFPVSEGISDLTRTRSFVMRYRDSIRIDDFIREDIAAITYYWKVLELKPIGRERYLQALCGLIDSRRNELPPVAGVPEGTVLSWDFTAFRLPDFIVGRRIPGVVFPMAFGGEPPYVYTATNLPDGLSFNAETLSLDGNPVNISDSSMLLTVTDAEGEVVQRSVGYRIISVMGALDWRETLERPRWTTGFEIDPFVLPAPTGGEPPYGYRALNLPSGLSFTGGNRAIIGTPTEDIFERLIATYNAVAQLMFLDFSVTDANGVQDLLRGGGPDFPLFPQDTPEQFGGRENPGLDVGFYPPLAWDFTVPSMLWIAGTPVENAYIPPPTAGRVRGGLATGGNLSTAVLDPYAVDPNTPLPPGIVLDAETGLLTGTPTEAGEGVLTFTTAISGTVQDGRQGRVAIDYVTVPAATLFGKIKFYYWDRGQFISNAAFDQFAPDLPSTEVEINAAFADGEDDVYDFPIRYIKLRPGVGLGVPPGLAYDLPDNIIRDILEGIRTRDDIVPGSFSPKIQFAILLPFNVHTHDFNADGPAVTDDGFGGLGLAAERLPRPDEIVSGYSVDAAIENILNRIGVTISVGAGLGVDDFDVDVIAGKSFGVSDVGVSSWNPPNLEGDSLTSWPSGENSLGIGSRGGRIAWRFEDYDAVVEQIFYIATKSFPFRADLPQVVGGRLPITVAVAPDQELWPGLSFNAETLEITGTPEAIPEGTDWAFSTAYKVDIWATDADGERVGLDMVRGSPNREDEDRGFRYRVSDFAPQGDLNVLAEQMFQVNLPLVDIDLGGLVGTPSVRLITVDPSTPLPAGLELESSWGRNILSGTPTTAGTGSIIFNVETASGVRPWLRDGNFRERYNFRGTRATYTMPYTVAAERVIGDSKVHIAVLKRLTGETESVFHARLDAYEFPTAAEDIEAAFNASDSGGANDDNLVRVYDFVADAHSDFTANGSDTEQVSLGNVVGDILEESGGSRDHGFKVQCVWNHDYATFDFAGFGRVTEDGDELHLMRLLRVFTDATASIFAGHELTDLNNTILPGKTYFKSEFRVVVNPVDRALETDVLFGLFFS